MFGITILEDNLHVLPLLLLVICLIPLWQTFHPSHPKPRGCRRLGLPQQRSNLHDEFDHKYKQPQPNTSNSTPSWRVKALFTYPLKSCAGIELQSAEVVATGLKYDRQFVFAEQTSTSESEGWIVRTLRNKGYNRLALIQPEIWVPDPTIPGYDPSLPEIRSGGVLVVSYPRYIPSGLMGIPTRIGMALNILSQREGFSIPLKPPQDQDPKFNLVPVKIWKDTLQAHNYGAFLPASFHAYMNHNPKSSKLTLLASSPQHSRAIYRNAPPKSTLGFQPTTAFADAYPIHLLNLSSHLDVASRCSTLPNLSICRFRANIIMEGLAPFEEDTWKRIRIGNTEHHVVCRTVRCKLPNVDPGSGERHSSEPDATLRAYRRVDEGDRGNACLGMQLVPAKEEGFWVRVGDNISVLETGEHRYIKLLEPGERVEGV